MKVLYFDCFSGISGDMTLGALLDLGVDEQSLRRELDKLKLDGYKLVIGKSIKNGITGMDVNVILTTHHHHSDHSHTHTHAHDHHARNLRDIELLIEESDLSLGVKNFGKKVFREIAAAEAKVHDKDIYEVHFHEVGAVDSIVDIVGTAICLDLLGVDRVYASKLYDGHGFIECQHGIIPVPVPAVMEMLSGSRIPLIQTDINTELITPTGMGIIKSLSLGFGTMPEMSVDRVGYGMGKRETGGFNALRVVIGTMDEAEKDTPNEIVLLETNIDDMSGEALGYTMEQLFENGALDVFYTPIFMKKNRPAVILTVIATIQNEEKLADMILRETTTLGIRRSRCQRYCMNREIVKASTEFGDVRVKVASRNGIVKYAPEYDDCRNMARKTGQTFIEVYNAVLRQVVEG
ncbi:nickel pincer cofactor biosynthesis protein LarC [Desulfosporosinus sp. Sb-LF]|uniref:nickel pincer cofactor biosynthesis protein LarC n=1 Tax=Desulfosporosinus sp. Sb-LF TaxID=2560027 RepID=UPI00107FBD39|nr:nickel pincer cofactor biosynthesis protein LarC [Desulfosporosinus sp. Sb-LF]TGE34378.1 nickel pincer cofactor biosynthesis protein LarC [Desulfosporosinus sp. Sb-LF]